MLSTAFVTTCVPPQIRPLLLNKDGTGGLNQVIKKHLGWGTSGVYKTNRGYLFKESPLFTCLAYAHLSDFVFREMGDSNKYVNYYCGSVEEDVASGFFNRLEHALLMENMVYYTLVVFCTLGIEENKRFMHFLSPLHSDIAQTSRDAIQGFITALRENIIVTLQDPEKNAEFAEEVADFYYVLLQEITRVQESQILWIEKHLSGDKQRRVYARFPSYWSKSVNRKMCICALMSRTSTLKMSSFISNLATPNISCFKYDIPPSIRVDEKLLIETFVMLGRNLPQDFSKNEQIMNYINQFRNYIWDTRNMPMPQMHKYGIEVRDVFEEYGGAQYKNEAQILMQIFCYHLPGKSLWWKIWMLKHYPQTNEIRRRLLFLRNAEKWFIPDREIVRMIFMK